MTGTSEQRIAEALERIDGNLGRIADVLEEGGLNDIADAFTIIAMARGLGHGARTRGR